MLLQISNSPEESSERVAEVIVNRINEFGPTMHHKFIMAIPACETLKPLYRVLERACKAQQVTFEYVVMVILDEYAGIGAEHPDSKALFIETELFSHIDIPPGQTVLLSGKMPDPLTECATFEARLTSLGGVHLLLVEIGEDGSVASNYPGGSLGARTRIIDIPGKIKNTPDVSVDQMRPSQALSMGLGTMMQSQEVVLLATGEDRANALREALQGGITHLCPAGIFQLHPELTVFADHAAATLLDPEIKALLSSPSSSSLSPSISPLSSLPALPSPGISTPPDLFSLLPFPSASVSLAYPFSTIPTPSLNPIMEENPLDAALMSFRLTEAEDRVTVTRKRSARRPSLSVITEFKGGEPGLDVLGGEKPGMSLGNLIKVQDGEQDDAGPGW